MNTSDAAVAEWERMNLTQRRSPLPWAAPGTQLIQGPPQREKEKNGMTEWGGGADTNPYILILGLPLTSWVTVRGHFPSLNLEFSPLKSQR